MDSKLMNLSKDNTHVTNLSTDYSPYNISMDSIPTNSLSTDSMFLNSIFMDSRPMNSTTMISFSTDILSMDILSKGNPFTHSLNTDELFAYPSRTDCETLESNLTTIDSLVLGEATTLPGEDTTLHGEDTTVPGEEAPVPGEEAAVPGKETTIPGEETAISGEETIIPGGDTIVPAKEATMLGEKNSSSKLLEEQRQAEAVEGAVIAPLEKQLASQLLEQHQWIEIDLPSLEDLDTIISSYLSEEGTTQLQPDIVTFLEEPPVEGHVLPSSIHSSNFSQDSVRFCRQQRGPPEGRKDCARSRRQRRRTVKSNQNDVRSCRHSWQVSEGRQNNVKSCRQRRRTLEGSEGAVTSSNKPRRGTLTLENSLTKDEKRKRARELNNAASRLYRQRVKHLREHVQEELKFLEEKNKELKGKVENLNRVKKIFKTFIKEKAQLGNLSPAANIFPILK
nr:uncharacterized protein LOC128688193 [Cherax quadricarinatus]